MWPTSPDELIAAQRALAVAAPDPWQPSNDPPAHDVLGHVGRHAQGSLGPCDPEPAGTAIGAVVVVFARGQAGPGASGDRAWASGAVLRRRRVLDEAVLSCAAGAPYVPGLLALREGPCLESALRALSVAPDVLLVDATGRDHPRRAGLALHLGAMVGLPTVGVTHRPLLAHGDWPGADRGAVSPLRLDGEVVGAWLRTRAGARPLAIHPGWRTSLEVAIDVVLSSARGHRTPEPLRHARRLARIARAARG